MYVILKAERGNRLSYTFWDSWNLVIFLVWLGIAFNFIPRIVKILNHLIQFLRIIMRNSDTFADLIEYSLML